MDQSYAAISGTAIGAASALLGAVIAGYFSMRVERSRHLQLTRGEVAQEVRKQAAYTFSKMFEIQHEIQKICWYAKTSGKGAIAELTKPYYAAVDRAWPEFLGAFAVVASLDEGIYEQLRPWADRLTLFEADVAAELEALRNGNNAAVDRLIAYHPEAYEIYQALPLELAKIMKASRHAGF